MKHVCLSVIAGLSFLFAGNFDAGAQPDYTFGLNRPLDEQYMPKSKAPMQKAVRIAKKDIPGRLDKISETDYSISAGWELSEAYKVTASMQSPLSAGISTKDWYNATVPGTVLTSLVDNGVYPDPYWGLNNLSIPDTLCRMDWWYRVEFDAPEKTTGENVNLVFNGINYRAEVWFNEKLLGNINGAFVRGIFNVSDIIRTDGKNVLAVRILPPNNPGIPHEQNPHMLGKNGGLHCIDGPTFISSEGWDWVPGIRDRNIGIWQDVRLSYSGKVSVKDPQIITDLNLPDTTKAVLTVKTTLKNNSASAVDARLVFEVADIKVTETYRLDPHSELPVVLSHEKTAGMVMKNPELWWPNGYGRQHLYTASLSVQVGDKVSDKEEIRFGVREFDYDIQIVTTDGYSKYVEFNPIEAYKEGKPVLNMLKRKKVDEKESVFAARLFKELPVAGIKEIGDQPTSPFIVIKVNGVKIFCKGGNWGMDDAMKNVSREHLEPYLKLHHDQHFNMIRNWTGESTETALYDLCDEYGILVFNDFWLSTEGYNIPAVDHRLFMANVDEVIKRHRNHPSIVIWSPRNEGFAPQELEKELSKSIASLDGTRHYIGSSIKLNTTVSGPWTPEMPVTYYNPEINRGFNSEIGAPCVPTAESMRKMMAEEDLWPISDVWSYHTWLNGGWLRFGSWEKMVAEQYGEFTGLEDFCAKSQLFGFDAYRAIFEAAHSKLWDNTSGVLLWMSHPAWPSMAYQTYTWDYETTGPYFGCMVACKPLHVQMKLNDKTVQIINNKNKDFGQLTVRAGIYDLDGRLLRSEERKFPVAANSKTDCFIHNRRDLPGVYLLRLDLRDAKGAVLDRNDYWLNGEKSKDLRALSSLEKTDARVVSVKNIGDNKYSVSVKNNGKCPAIGLKLNVKDIESGASVLPAYFSEGYFTLLPKEKKTVVLEMPSGAGIKRISIEGYNVTANNYTL